MSSAASPPNWRMPPSNRPIVIDQPWTDWAGRRHDKMIGRPVAMHAMRGISAHSNGFQTCRAIHVLQMLLGASIVPGQLPLQAALPAAYAARRQADRPRRRRPPGKPMPGRRSASRPRRRICWSRPTARRGGIDKAYSWEAPLAAHGLMHMVIRNAWGRSLQDRYAVHVHGEHELELVDEHGRHHRDADRQGSGDRRLQDPAHHLLRRLCPRWWPMPT
jgi:hypothetical protein